MKILICLLKECPVTIALIIVLLIMGIIGFYITITN
jgi:hypothetical protein